MRVFLTGATGYIGSAVGEALLRAGHEVIGLVHSDRRVPPGVEAWPGDLYRLETLLDPLRRAAEDSPLAPIPVDLWRAGVERRVLEAAERNIRTVVIRPAMVYGRGGGLVTEFVKSADDLADLYVRALTAPPGTLVIAASAEGRTQTLHPNEAYNQMGPWVQGLVLDQRVSGKRAEKLLGWTPQGRSVLDGL